ncbi:GNAT family N-acetyltransferase [Paenibacillus tritici]|uniref:GNAT family N-acetyltransferase n=1 Tax=Paenibacillus tritici TaxID=1873425 RepID=UPI001BA66573|nr:GNAT family N-acetyltransferase [Paenibacillus tritici]QUL52729.1 GNAT family N-acetyltransferase [Paenibacillus tritici]
MIELHASRYNEIRHLLTHKDGDFIFVFVQGVMDLNQPGRIFVNNIDQPTAGIVASRGGKYYLFGQEDDHLFNQSLIGFLANPANHANFYDLYFSSNHWLVLLEEPLKENTVELNRTHYIMNGDAAIPVEVQEDSGEFILTRIDEQLFERYNQEMDDSYRLLWDSAETYLDKAFGYCYLNEGGFVSACNTFYVGGGYIEPDIITQKDYRNQGLAFRLCQEFIELARQRKLTTYWDCDTGNTGSNHLAGKLGMAKVGELPILWWHESKEVIAKYLASYNYTT